MELVHGIVLIKVIVVVLGVVVLVQGDPTRHPVTHQLHLNLQMTCGRYQVQMIKLELLSEEVDY